MRRAAILVALGLASVAHAAPIEPSTRQLVVVLSDGWRSTRGTLQRWMRPSKGRWRAIGEPVEVVLGRAGMGWGAGLDDPFGRRASEPEKREGDERSPAGVFAFDGGFGDAPRTEIRIPFRAPGERYLCVDDPESPDYNRIVEAESARPHKNAERLSTNDQQYSLGVVVAHNRAPITKGRGSCIFLHVWAAAEAPTVGCTAMARDDLVEIVRWLDPGAEPRIVQLPRAVYRARRRGWRLP